MSVSTAQRAKAIASLLEPIETEKSVRVNESANQYVFKVHLNATKKMISMAVEELFNVQVSQISTTILKGKVKRNKFGIYRKPRVKKAYVTVAQGKKIDFLK